MVTNPIDNLHKSVNKPILVKVKRNRIFKGILKSFDNHMNILIDDCTYSYKADDGEGNLKEITEDFDEIILRGDNIVFLEFSPQ